MPQFKVTFRDSAGNIKTDTLQTTQANMDNLLKGDRFLTGDLVNEAPEKQLTAEFKGDKDFEQQTFTGTRAEIEAEAKKIKSKTSSEVGINPANLFFDGSDTAGVVPTEPKTVDELTNGTGNISDIDPSDVPDFLKNTPYWDDLTDEEKKLKLFEYNAQIQQKDENKQEYVDALEKAKDLVDPYYAQNITIAQDEILRGFQNIEAASQQRLELIERNIARIDEDLATGTERLGIDEQAALTRLKSSFENTLVDLQNKVSDSGLAFSSRAGDLLSRAAIEKKDVQTSTNRSFDKQIKDLNQQAERGIQDQESAREEQERLRAINLTALARESEKALGSQSYNELKTKLDSGLQDVLGDIDNLGIETGTLKQERDAQVINTTNSIIAADGVDLSNL